MARDRILSFCDMISAVLVIVGLVATVVGFIGTIYASSPDLLSYAVGRIDLATAQESLRQSEQESFGGAYYWMTFTLWPAFALGFFIQIATRIIFKKPFS